MAARPLAAQSFTTLYSFSALSDYTNLDGANPYGAPNGLVLSGSTLFGTATFGGSNGSGSVFAININGTGFTNLYSFTAINPTTGTNADGAEPNGLILSGSTLYGTAYSGGTNGNGTIFALNTNGSGFLNLHNFSELNESTGTNFDGANPFSAPVLSGSTLYGTAANGGNSGNGTVFSVGANGGTLVPLHSFGPLTANTNSDGAHPQEALVLSGGTLYGSVIYGGTNGAGTLFGIKTTGAGFTNLYAFTALGSGPQYTNRDGAYPNGIAMSGGMLYGTANSGGSNGAGAVFGINTNGGGFTNLYSFTGTNGAGDNTDGAYPFAGTLSSGSTLYAVTGYGGPSGNGTLFAINTNGTGFLNFHSFSVTNSGGVNSDGSTPQAGLIVANEVLYGTAYFGGASGNGAIFGVSFAPVVTIASSGTHVTLTWPTNEAGFSYAGFTLQSTTNLIPPVTWNNVSPAPLVVNGLNTVTNPVSGTPVFYRLSQ